MSDDDWGDDANEDWGGDDANEDWGASDDDANEGWCDFEEADSLEEVNEQIQKAELAQENSHLQNGENLLISMTRRENYDSAREIEDILEAYVLMINWRAEPKHAKKIVDIIYEIAGGLSNGNYLLNFCCQCQEADLDELFYSWSGRLDDGLQTLRLCTHCWQHVPFLQCQRCEFFKLAGEINAHRVCVSCASIEATEKLIECEQKLFVRGFDYIGANPVKEMMHRQWHSVQFLESRDIHKILTSAFTLMFDVDHDNCKTIVDIIYNTLGKMELCLKCDQQRFYTYKDGGAEQYSFTVCTHCEYKKIGGHCKVCKSLTKSWNLNGEYCHKHAVPCIDCRFPLDFGTHFFCRKVTQQEERWERHRPALEGAQRQLQYVQSCKPKFHQELVKPKRALRHMIERAIRSFVSGYYRWGPRSKIFLGGPDGYLVNWLMELGITAEASEDISRCIQSFLGKRVSLPPELRHVSCDVCNEPEASQLINVWASKFAEIWQCIQCVPEPCVPCRVCEEVFCVDDVDIFQVCIGCSRLDKEGKSEMVMQAAGYQTAVCSSITPTKRSPETPTTPPPKSGLNKRDPASPYEKDNTIIEIAVPDSTNGNMRVAAEVFLETTHPSRILQAWLLLIGGCSESSTYISETIWDFTDVTVLCSVCHKTNIISPQERLCFHCFHDNSEQCRICGGGVDDGSGYCAKHCMLCECGFPTDVGFHPFCKRLQVVSTQRDVLCEMWRDQKLRRLAGHERTAQLLGQIEKSREFGGMSESTAEHMARTKIKLELDILRAQLECERVGRAIPDDKYQDPSKYQVFDVAIDSDGEMQNDTEHELHVDDACVMVEQLRDCMRDGLSVDSRDSNGMTPLMMASERNSIEVVVYLINSGCNLDFRNIEGYTALMIACIKGHDEIASILLSAGCNQDLINNNESSEDAGRKAITMACQHGHTKIVSLLTQLSHDPDAKVFEETFVGVTPLMQACRNGATDFIFTLLRAGSDVNARTEKGETALIIACSMGHYDAAAMLMRHGCDLFVRDKYGLCALIHACQGGHEDVVAELMDYGANLNPQDNQGLTALMHACRIGNWNIVDRLIYADCDLDMQDNDNKTALMHACWCGHEKAASLLLEAGCDINVKDNDGDTAYNHAMLGGHEEILRKIGESKSQIRKRWNRF